MKKIIKMKDLPTEQRIRLELILERNRVKKPKQAVQQKSAEAVQQKSTETKKRIKQKEQLTKYTAKLPLTFGKNDFEKWLNNNLN